MPMEFARASQQVAWPLASLCLALCLPLTPPTARAEDAPWRTNFDLTQTNKVEAGWQEQRIVGSLFLQEGEPGEPTLLMLEAVIRRKTWPTEAREGKPIRTREPLSCLWQGALDSMEIAPEMPLICEGAFSMSCHEDGDSELFCRFEGAVPPLVLALQADDGMLLARGHNVRISVRSDDRSSADKAVTPG